jgi:hypothetical protein
VTTPHPNIRIGDKEREQAIEALGEHFTAGRLDVDEYGERTARVTTAKTRGELREIFTDLPEPHPSWETPAAPPPVSAPAQREDRPVYRRQAIRSALGLTWIAAIVVVATIHVPYVIFAPIVLWLIFGLIWGKPPRRGHTRDRD